jgi:hypothetical protein
MAAPIRFLYHLSMQTHGEDKPLTTEELLKGYQLLREECDNSERKRQAECEKKKIWMFITLAFFGIYLYNTKSGHTWWADLDDGTIGFENSDWWGLSRQHYYPVWRKETGTTADDVKRWCIRYPDGTWHTFIWRVGDEGPADLYFPPAFPPAK